MEVDGKNLCGLAVLETMEGKTSHLLKDSVVPQEMVIRSAMRNCQVEVDFVVIGAGGSYSNKGGGGSGFVDSSKQFLWEGDKISINFVNDELSFKVKVSDQEIIQSRPGMDGNSARGKVKKNNIL